MVASFYALPPYFYAGGHIPERKGIVFPEMCLEERRCAHEEE